MDSFGNGDRKVMKEGNSDIKRIFRRIALVFYDMCAVVIASFGALLLRFDLLFSKLYQMEFYLYQLN